MTFWAVFFALQVVALACAVCFAARRIQRLDRRLDIVTKQRDDAHAWLLGDRPSKESA